ncbi:MAG TPA: hypothetical protein VGZ33_07930, partial [Acidimicrobiales bacterium]|nr:hypothetical protein [Acidimicrobiales bacterium]
MTAVPVDHAVDGVADGRHGTLEAVPHVVAVLADVDHAGLPERAGVVGLPTTGGVEGRPVETHLDTVDRGHDGVELIEVGVAEEEKVGHAGSTGDGGGQHVLDRGHHACVERPELRVTGRRLV